MPEDDIQFIDAEAQYSDKKEGLTFQQIVLSHVRKILEISTNEFRGGHFKIIQKDNSSVEEYIPNTRKIYIQAVESLSDILLPHFDKEMNKDYDELMKEVEVLEKKFPPMNTQLERKYTIEKIKLMRILFQMLNLLLARKRYFEGKVIRE